MTSQTADKFVDKSLLKTKTQSHAITRANCNTNKQKHLSIYASAKTCLTVTVNDAANEACVDCLPATFSLYQFQYCVGDLLM